MGNTVKIVRPDGKEESGYLAPAIGKNAPGVVVIQEWWGVQGQIKSVCDKLADAGYNALAPDLFRGLTVPYHNTAAAEEAMNSLDFQDATEQTVRGAVQLLAKDGARVAITGFCMGGAIAVIGAARIPELSAAVPFYGLPPESVTKPSEIKIPVQGHFANKDDWCTPELVNRFEEGAVAAGKTVEVFRYDADHAFANEERATVHDHEAAELAWKRAISFLSKHLITH